MLPDIIVFWQLQENQKTKYLEGLKLNIQAILLGQIKFAELPKKIVPAAPLFCETTGKKVSSWQPDKLYPVLRTFKSEDCRRRRLSEAALTPGQLHDYGHHAETRKGTSGNVVERSQIDKIFDECKEVLVEQFDHRDQHPQVAIGHAGHPLPSPARLETAVGVAGKSAFSRLTLGATLGAGTVMAVLGLLALHAFRRARRSASKTLWAKPKRMVISASADSDGQVGRQTSVTFSNRSTTAPITQQTTNVATTNSNGSSPVPGKPCAP
eukprot:GHVT01053102.1.p1 GENE.GHVT01053102.1~~GHVT01053102.1.p1  ORF type:complete len:267 (-),score=35.39 GHVT01053102.1:1119-1919(-)